jgi:hypothetical protein
MRQKRRKAIGRLGIMAAGNPDPVAAGFQARAVGYDRPRQGTTTRLDFNVFPVLTDGDFGSPRTTFRPDT